MNNHRRLYAGLLCVALVLLLFRLRLDCAAMALCSVKARHPKR